MKKASIAATKQSRNISPQKLTIGLDLGDRNSWYCVVDEAGQIEPEQRVGTNAKALQEVFGAMPRSPWQKHKSASTAGARHGAPALVRALHCCRLRCFEPFLGLRLMGGTLPSTHSGATAAV
jgi:hypothetical protein